ncbi:MAG: hypothetical protein IAA72_08800 [Spirochaetes bacterium]|uniref:Large polyvalent protein associated domain-containing protein n=1 Tax=Candidatus Ornithospirochaeta stercoravium TaxID=2840897 RepID=A0A9D9IC31_9SPIO|nr:hypothetical protein [Candidatus Ornithospirochaeta stercoravium]
MPYGSLTGDLYSMSSGKRAGYAESNNPASFLRSLIPSQKKNEEDESKPDSGKPSSGLAGTITHQPKDSMNGQKDSGLQQNAKAPQSDIETAIANVSNQYAIWFGDRYAFTPKEAETFRTLVSGSADPVDTAGRYIASTAIAKRIDGNAADIYANLDSLSEYFTGDVYRPDDSTFMEKVNASFGSIELLDMMGEWMNLVNKKGFDDPDAVALEQKIIAKDAEIGGIMNGIPSGFWSSVLNDAVASLGYTLEGIKYGAGASVGFMAAAAPGVGAVTAANPIAGAAVGATAGIWAGFSGTVAGFQRTGDLSMYQTFWDLTHLTDAEGNLLPRDKAAANLYAGINKNITGFLETMGDGVISRGIGAFSPVLTKKLGIPNLSMKILTDRGVSGSMSRFVYGGIDWVTGGLNEGFIQEGPEEVTTQVLTALYKNGVGGESDISLKKLASDYLTSSIRGSLVGLVYGGVGIPQAMRNYNQLSMDLRRTANTTDSEEVFFEKTENAKPEDISKEDYDAARKQIYEAGKEQRDAYFEARRGTVTEYADLATEELYDTVNPETGTEEGVLPDGTVYRNPEDNSLFTETREENGRKRVYAGDKRTGAVYGYAEVSTDGDTLTVGSVRVRQGYEGIREELVRKAISEERTGESSIEWNPDSEGLRRVKDMLVQNNPRGSEAGLDYGADFSAVQDHDIQSLAGNIREAMPALSREESVVAARLYSVADSDGTLSKLNNGQPVQKNDSLSARYRGAADGAKAIIYAGKNADFSTFYHELFHVNATQRPAESKQLSNAIRTSMQDEASKANLRKFLEESGSIWGDGFNADSVMKNLESIPADSDASQWSRAQFEDLAHLAEAYAAADNSKRSSLPEAIRNILKKIADFMKQVYQTVKHTVPLPKEITDAYDAIMYKTRTEAKKTVSSDSGLMYQGGEQYQETEAELKANPANFDSEGRHLAPNGKPSNLSYEQWVTVRTPAFKRWFGDWEHAYRINKWLSNENVLAIDPDKYSGLYELNWRSAKRYALDNLRGQYKVDDNGAVIELTRDGVSEIISENMGSELGLKLIAHLPNIIENSIFVYAEENQKSKNTFDYYEYYLTDISVDSKNYVVKSAVGVRNGRRYYTFNLSEIKDKGAFINSRPVSDIQPGRPTSQGSLSDIKDTRLLSILQADSSKMVDENGEPLVVYHGTASEFSIFDRGKLGSSTAANSANIGFFFSDNRNTAEGYGNYASTSEARNLYAEAEKLERQGRWDEAEALQSRADEISLSDNNGFVMSTFLNMRNPYEVDAEGAGFQEIGNLLASFDSSRNDGVIIHSINDNINGDYEAEHYIVLDSKQIKSIDNRGTFDSSNPDIYYQSAYHGSPHSFDRFSTDHIGTGEGSQSFGWGIYVTDSGTIARGYAELGYSEESKASDIAYYENLIAEGQKKVDELAEKLRKPEELAGAVEEERKAIIERADNLRKALADGSISRIPGIWGAVADRLGTDIDGVERYLLDELNEGKARTSLKKEYDSAVAALERTKERLVETRSAEVSSRNLYTVEIPDSGYLYWDRKVPKSLAERIARKLNADEYDTADIMDYFRNSGEDMYVYLEKQLGSDKAASQFLSELGVVGINYPAGTNIKLPAGVSSKSRNYVIFNADDIQITDHLMYQDAKAPDTSDLSEDEKMKRQQAESVESRETLPGSSEDLDDFYDEYNSGMDSIATPEDAEKIARIYSEWDIEVDEEASNTDASLIDEEEIPDWFGDTVNLKPDGTMAENEAEYEKAVNEELIPELEREAGVVHESRETQPDTGDEAEGQNYPGIRYFDAFDEELTWKQFVDRNKPEADYSQAETEAEKDDLFARTIQDDDSLIRYLGIIGEALYLNTSRLNNDWHFIDQIQRERIKARVFDTITDTSIRNASLMAIRPGTERSFSKRMLNSVRKEMTENSRFYRNIISYMLQDNAMKPEELIKEVKGLAIPSRDVLDAMPVSELRALAMQARDEEIVDQIENGTLRIHGGEDDKRLAEINAAIGSIGERIRTQQAELRENEASISSLQENLESVSTALDERDKSINDLLSDLQRTEAIARADAKKLSDEEIEASSFTDSMRKIAAELRELNEKTYDRIETEHLRGKKGKYEVPQARRDARAEYINHIAAFYPEVFEKDGKKFGKLDDHIRDTLSPSGFREVQEVINARREELRTQWKNEAAKYVQNLSRSVVNTSERLSSDIDAALDRMAALQKEIDRQKKLKDRIKDNRRQQIFNARTEERWKAAKKALETEKKHNQEIQNIKSFNAWKNRQTKIETDEKLQSVIRKAKDDASLLADWMKAKADFRISELKKEQREKRKQERLYRRIRTEKEKLGRAISRPVNLNTTDYSVAEPIMAIQAIVDPVFRTEWTWNLETNPEGTAGGGTMTITDAIAYLSNLQEDDRNNILSVLSPDLVARLTGTRNPLNDWSLSQLRQLAEEVSELRRRGREILSAKKAFERETVERIQQSIIDAVRRVKVKDDDRDTLPGSVERIKAGQNARARFRSARYITMRMQELAQLLDGGLGHRGAAYSLLVDEKRYHQSREWRAIDSRIQKVANLLTDEAVKNLFEKVTLDLPGGYKVTFNVDDLAYAYLSQFDEDSRAAVAYGNLLDEKEKGTVKNKGHLNDDGEFVPDMMSPGSIADADELQSLGDARYDIVLAAAEKELNERGLMPLVEAIRDDFESDENFNRLNLASIESYNTPLKRVQHYLPIFRTDLKGESFRNDMADQLFNLNTGDFTAAIDKGMTIQRIKIAPRNQRSVNLSLLGTWNKSVRNQEHLIEYAQYAKKLRSVFGTNATELIAAVNQKYSPALMKEVNEYINAVIDPYSGGKKELWENTVKNLRGRLGSAYLGWKLPGVVLQFCTSAWPFLPDVGVRSLFGGYLQLAAENKRAFDFIYEKSPMMKHRTMNTILQEAVERRQNSYDRGKAGRAIDKFNEIGMLGLEWVDKTLVAGGWLGAYNKALKQNLDAGMDTALADAAAAKTADDVVLRTQPAGDSTELPSLFRTRNELAKAFLQFQSSLSVIFNNLTGDLVGFWRNKQYGKIISTVVSYGMAGLMLGLVAEGFDDDDDGADKARKLGYWFLTQGIESFPVFGSDISLILQRALTGEKDYYGNGVDMFPGITRIASGIEDIALSDKPFMEGVWKVAEGAGLFAGAPVSGFKNLKRVAEEGPLALLGR